MYQTRCVAAFPDERGFLTGSIEGKVRIHHLDDSEEMKNFTFKCHRDAGKIYSVNSLNFHPVYHTFASAGSDGVINFSDKDSKMRIKAMARCAQPITCSAFNSDGSRFAYAGLELKHYWTLQVGYDWSKGILGKANAKGCNQEVKSEDAVNKMSRKLLSVNE
ncbi:hypothetical protein MRB53_000126 [Persea americana]|uniref:Uncharacterized protein n=1 Tax=Persea americana TaxID=3435 RepID=A0ACC2MNL8_PERAE|nr:hypothetical protein MRB53_000126 [Persea americana]